MYQEVSCSDFIQAFAELGCEEFSREALVKIFEHLEEIGDEGAMDVLDVCAEFAELDLGGINAAYNQAFESLDEAVDWLASVTVVVGANDSSIVFVQF